MFVVHNIISLFYNVCDLYLHFFILFICVLTLFLLGLYVWLIFFIEPAFDFVNILFHSVSLTFPLCLYSHLVFENMDNKWFIQGHRVKKGWDPGCLFLPLQSAPSPSALLHSGSWPMAENWIMSLAGGGRIHLQDFLVFLLCCLAECSL